MFLRNFFAMLTTLFAVCIVTTAQGNSVSLQKKSIPLHGVFERIPAPHRDHSFPVGNIVIAIKYWWSGSEVLITPIEDSTVVRIQRDSTKSRCVELFYNNEEIDPQKVSSLEVVLRVIRTRSAVGQDSLFKGFLTELRDLYGASVWQNRIMAFSPDSVISRAVGRFQIDAIGDMVIFRSSRLDTFVTVSELYKGGEPRVDLVRSEPVAASVHTHLRGCTKEEGRELSVLLSQILEDLQTGERVSEASCQRLFEIFGIVVPPLGFLDMLGINFVFMLWSLVFGFFLTPALIDEYIRVRERRLRKRQMTKERAGRNQRAMEVLSAMHRFQLLRAEGLLPLNPLKHEDCWEPNESGARKWEETSRSWMIELLEMQGAMIIREDERLYVRVPVD